MFLVVIFLVLFFMVFGVRFFENMQQKKQGYILKMYAEVSYIKGIDTNSETTIKLYHDRITFNNIATIPIKKITKVSYINPFIRKGRGRRIYLTQPYFHDMTIDYISVSGQNSWVRFEKIGNISGSMQTFREKALQLTNMGEENVPTQSKPYQL